MKTFYKEDSTLNNEGAVFSLACDKYFNDIFENYMKLDYSIREITQLLMSSLTYTESKKSIEFSDKFNLNKRIENAKLIYGKNNKDNNDESESLSSKSSNNKKRR